MRLTSGRTPCSKDQVVAASESEIISVYPHRWAVPREIWGRLFEQANDEIGVLVYSAMFLGEDAGLKKTLADKAKAGARVRILLGDPDSPRRRTRDGRGHR